MLPIPRRSRLRDWVALLTCFLSIEIRQCNWVSESVRLACLKHRWVTFSPADSCGAGIFWYSGSPPQCCCCCFRPSVRHVQDQRRLASDRDGCQRGTMFHSWCEGLTHHPFSSLTRLTHPNVPTLRNGSTREMLSAAMPFFACTQFRGSVGEDVSRTVILDMSCGDVILLCFIVTFQISRFGGGRRRSSKLSSRLVRNGSVRCATRAHRRSFWLWRANSSTT